MHRTRAGTSGYLNERAATGAKGGGAKAAKKAARNATIAKGVATKKADKGVVWKKADKGVVRAAVTVMLMTAGSVLSDKLADAAAEQVRIAHEEFAVEEQRIGKAIEADEGAYRPRIQERNAKAAFGKSLFHVQ